MKLPDQKKKPKKKPGAKPATALQFHGPEIPKDRSEFMKGLKYLPSNIPGMEQLFGKDAGGYPIGSIINFVSIPKAGKTTTMAYEALGWARQNMPVWVMYNESTRGRYTELWNRHRLDLGISDKEYIKLPISFVSAFGKHVTSRPKYDIIRSMMGKWVQNPLRAYLEKLEKKDQKPAALIFDSLTAFYREWAPQAYIFVEEVVKIMHELFQEFRVRPVVFCISQKASKEWGKDDEQGFGGYGPVHVMDGSMVISMYQVDQWLTRSSGFPRGSVVRFIRMNLRDIYGSEDQHIYTQEIDPDNNGLSNLFVGKSWPIIDNEWKETQAKEGVD